ncbi:hypothetical protein [Gracilimonas sp.]|uniref:hypothetical protein n=1 Tax=Gracilimonas sp. TaxID=1974203 RepID=UPI0032EFD07E
MEIDLTKTIQIAMHGEIPPTLRFMYASFSDNELKYLAVFTDDAPEEHLECARVISTEIISACPLDTELNETIVRDSKRPWKIDNGKNLRYLRYGELSDT